MRPPIRLPLTEWRCERRAFSPRAPRNFGTDLLKGTVEYTHFDFGSLSIDNDVRGSRPAFRPPDFRNISPKDVHRLTPPRLTPQAALRKRDRRWPAKCAQQHEGAKKTAHPPLHLPCECCRDSNNSQNHPHRQQRLHSIHRAEHLLDTRLQWLRFPCPTPQKCKHSWHRHGDDRRSDPVHSHRLIAPLLDEIELTRCRRRESSFPAKQHQHTNYTRPTRTALGVRLLLLCGIMRK